MATGDQLAHGPTLDSTAGILRSLWSDTLTMTPRRWLTSADAPLAQNESLAMSANGTKRTTDEPLHKSAFGTNNGLEPPALRSTLLRMDSALSEMEILRS